MSFGSGSGGGSRNSSSSFGGKGSAQKKEKKRKQEYHRHKLKYVEQEPVDFEHLKTRTTAALQKLGQQVFSTEPGGYSFQDWMKSFNFLLDDFEEKVGASNLPKEYLGKRSELTAELLKLVDTPEIDAELERIRKEQEDLNNKILQKDLEKKRAIEQERRETSSKIDSLRKQQRECTVELELAKTSLEEKKKTQKKSSSSSSFFKKLFSSKNSPDPNSVEGITNKIKDLEGKIRDAEEQIGRLQEERNSSIAKADSSDLGHAETETEEERMKLDSLKLELDELEAKKAERLQLAEKRAEITGAISMMISSINTQQQAN